MEKELSTIEKKLKFKSDDKLRIDIKTAFEKLKFTFDITNTFMPVDLLKKLTEEDSEAIRMSRIIEILANFLFNQYEDKYFQDEINDFINSVNRLENEIDELKSQIN